MAARKGIRNDGVGAAFSIALKAFDQSVFAMAIAQGPAQLAEKGVAHRPRTKRGPGRDRQADEVHADVPFLQSMMTAREERRMSPAGTRHAT
ncbi:protein of unknown function [Methylocaldum szegediense]|uniref:Uncharacterized protein n=1 Tax=Methylocaldum szegediense TaxID=73780 RepID=A0ABM9HYK5_9GAMM|nr:protein of unknown function [Methylocaldum szegediense]